MKKTLLKNLSVAVLAFLLVAPAMAVPAYSAAYGQKCMLCHTSPTGGGMRNAYASQFLLPSEMVFDLNEEESGGSIGADLSDQVSVGADLRTLFRYSPDDEHQAENNIFQMQGDLYFHFQMSSRFSATLEQGISGSYELFGSAFILPAGGYVKVGRFVPAYGWRFADHGMFVRQELGWAPPQHSDVGLELGFFPGKTSLNLSLLNGSRGATMDADDRFAAALRGEWRHSLGSMNVALGGSFYREQESGVERTLAGPFYYLQLGRFTLIGEADLESVAGRAGGNLLAHSQELRVRLHRGLDLRATYNYLDPDLDNQSGARRKMGIGADLLATPFFGVLGMFNLYRFDEGPAISGEDYAQAELVVHFLY